MKTLAGLTWKEAAEYAPGALAVVPVAAIEAHGPHLPLDTDAILVEEAIRRAAPALEAKGERLLVLPTLLYTPAHFAREFAGTIDAPPGALRDALAGAIEATHRLGVRLTLLLSGHLDPACVEVVRQAAGTRVAFADVLERRWASRLPEEFQRGGPHGGAFETSVVLAARPSAVRESVRRALPPVDVDLGGAIRRGARTFAEAGGPQAYFGDPASATPEQGDQIYGVLVQMIVTTVEEALRG